MPLNLPDLPYGKDALEPFISARTLDFHYGKHHKAYVDNTNKLIEGTNLANADTPRWHTGPNPFSWRMFGNTPTTWITRTGGRITSQALSRNSSTGIL
jgi:hypothetical protein